MILSFLCVDTEALFKSTEVIRVKSIERIARRKLLFLHADGAYQVEIVDYH